MDAFLPLNSDVPSISDKVNMFKLSNDAQKHGRFLNCAKVPRCLKMPYAAQAGQSANSQQ